LLTQQDRAAEARTWLSDAVEIRKARGADAASLAEAQLDLAHAMHALNEPVQAAALLALSLAVIDASDFPDEQLKQRAIKIRSMIEKGDGGS
jgi:hypothetical protein